MASKLTCPHQPASRWSHAWYGTIHEDEQSVLPTELDTTSHPRHLAVEMDKLTVRYIGRGNHSHDVGAVRTNSPCPPRSLLYYYEVTVVDAGLRGSIAVGLADESYPLNRHPGWESHSYAYHGEDGRRYHDSEKGEASPIHFFLFPPPIHFFLFSPHIPPTCHPPPPHFVPPRHRQLFLCLQAYGPPYASGDVIGCGLFMSSGDVFFTRNGTWLGIAYR